MRAVPRPDIHQSVPSTQSPARSRRDLGRLWTGWRIGRPRRDAWRYFARSSVSQSRKTTITPFSERPNMRWARSVASSPRAQLTDTPTWSPLGSEHTIKYDVTCSSTFGSRSLHDQRRILGCNSNRASGVRFRSVRSSLFATMVTRTSVRQTSAWTNVGTSASRRSAATNRIGWDHSAADRASQYARWWSMYGRLEFMSSEDDPSTARPPHDASLFSVGQAMGRRGRSFGLDLRSRTRSERSTKAPAAISLVARAGVMLAGTLRSYGHPGAGVPLTRADFIWSSRPECYVIPRTNLRKVPFPKVRMAGGEGSKTRPNAGILFSMQDGARLPPKSREAMLATADRRARRVLDRRSLHRRLQPFGVHPSAADGCEARGACGAWGCRSATTLRVLSDGAFVHLARGLSNRRQRVRRSNRDLPKRVCCRTR